MGPVQRQSLPAGPSEPGTHNTDDVAKGADPERRAGIPVLVEGYPNHLYPCIGRGMKGIKDGATASLVGYQRPDNVWKLINVTERAMLLCNGSDGGGPSDHFPTRANTRWLLTQS